MTGSTFSCYHLLFTAAVSYRLFLYSLGIGRGMRYPILIENILLTELYWENSKHFS